MGTRMKFTPWNYQIVVIQDKIQILEPAVVVDSTNEQLTVPDIVADSSLLWPSVINAYGVLRPGISQIRLEQSDGSEVIGTIVVDPNDDRLLIFSADPDTVPQNTLTPIDAVINPLLSAPGDGLPAAVAGQRYLITESTGSASNVSNPMAWAGVYEQPLIAQANDIIEYDGARWQVVFVSQNITDVEYITNLTTGLQYEWTGAEWIKSYQGVYVGGTWSLVL